MVNGVKVNFYRGFNAEVAGNTVYYTPDNLPVAQVFLKNYRYINLKFNPLSDKLKFAEVKLFKNKEPKELKEVNRRIYNDKNTYVCQHCGRRIIKVFSDKLYDYALYIECACGCAYNSALKWGIPETEELESDYFYKKYLQIYSGML